MPSATSRRDRTDDEPQAPIDISQLSDFGRRVNDYIRSGYQMMTIDTTEANRAVSQLREVARARNMPLHIWNVDSGWNGEGVQPGNTISVEASLKALIDPSAARRFGPRAIIVMYNLNFFWRVPTVAQILQDLVEGSMLNSSENMYPLFVVGAAIEPPKLLANCVTKIDFALPTEAELLRTVTVVAQAAAVEDRARAEATQEQRDAIAQALLGLSVREAENVLALSLVKNERLANPAILQTIEQEKAKAFATSKMLTYYSKDLIGAENEVGGFSIYKRWVHERHQCFSKRAREQNIDPMKGVVLLGPPGTGKSAIGKITARMFDLPLVIFDIGAVFGSLVGESEARMRDALHTVDAMQGCVLLIDEADKVWANATNSVGDSGVTQRIFGSFLTWLQEKRSPTFVIMTMNRTKGIPTEFLRKGRFDEVFYVDMPQPAERREILEIHLRKRGVEPSVFTDAEWSSIISETNFWVGAELEDLVKSARLLPFTEGRPPVPEYNTVFQLIKDTRTLYSLDKDGVDDILGYCRGRARPVSDQQTIEEQVERAGRRKSSRRIEPTQN